MAREMKNNQVKLSGSVAKEPKETYEMLGETFYVFELGVARLSGAVDRIPVMISGRTVDIEALREGTGVEVTGSFRSRNQHNPQKTGKGKLVLYVFADTITVKDTVSSMNEIVLDGYTCKPAKYRVTPLGREIADVLLAVNRNYGKSDYIPCVAWGRNASFASTLPIGSEIVCKGRIQSREYTKRLDDESTETRIAYEVSLVTIETHWEPMEDEEDD